MAPQTSSPSKNSTNVRTLSWQLRAMKAGLRALEATSPALAAKVGVELMFHTTRHPAPLVERELLARGERFSVLAGKRRLAAWSFGQGPTVLLVHGWNGRAGQLGFIVDPLLARGFRVVTFDAPGHGESEGTTASLPEFADAVDSVLEHVATPFLPVQAIVAHSMGGAAVTFAMSRHTRAPSAEHERALRDPLPVRRFAFVAPPIDLRDFVRGFSRLSGLGPETQAELTRRIESRLSLRLEELHAPTLARELDAPLLVVHDEGDREVPVRCGRELAAAWPGARLTITQGLGHTRILRDPAVIAELTAFVAGGQTH